MMPTNGVMLNWPTTVPSVGSAATTSTELGPQPDLLLRLAERGVAGVVVDARFDLPARERDLAPVRRHRLGPAGEHHARLAVLLEHGQEHRGRAAARLEAAARAAGCSRRSGTAPSTVMGPSAGRPDAREAQGAASPTRAVAGRGMRWRPPRAPESWFVDYFFLPAATLASTSRLERTRRSSPSTVTSVPPYFE